MRSTDRSGLQTPADERVISYLREHLAGSKEVTLGDFLAENRAQYPVEPGINSGGFLICVHDEEFEYICRDAEGWARFLREFPEYDGTLRISWVGLDGDVTQAILYAGRQFDRNVGSGGFWPFSEPDGEQTEADRVGNWLS